MSNEEAFKRIGLGEIKQGRLWNFFFAKKVSVFEACVCITIGFAIQKLIF